MFHQYHSEGPATMNKLFYLASGISPFTRPPRPQTQPEAPSPISLAWNFFTPGGFSSFASF